MIEDMREPPETTEVVPTVQYTQATINAALDLLQSGITLDEVFASVVKEHAMYRKMLGISEATFTTLDLSAYDEPEEDTTYPYHEYEGEDDGQFDFADFERDDGI